MDSPKTDDVFVQQARGQFLQYATLWSDFMAKSFPERASCADVHEHLTSVVPSAPAELDDLLTAWLDELRTPLHPKRCKYAKAIERLTKDAATMYHALKYRDTKPLREMKSGLFERMQVWDAYDAEDTTDECRTTILKFMEKLTDACFEATGERIPDVPTRSEIQESIRTRKDKHDDPPSMSKAFQTHLNALCKKVGVAPMLEGASDAQVQETMGRWCGFSTDEIDGVRVATLCKQRDASFRLLEFDRERRHGDRRRTSCKKARQSSTSNPRCSTHQAISASSLMTSPCTAV